MWYLSAVESRPYKVKRFPQILMTHKEPRDGAHAGPQASCVSLLPVWDQVPSVRLIRIPWACPGPARAPAALFHVLCCSSHPSQVVP